LENFIKVASVSDIQDGDMISAEIEDGKVIIARLEGEFYAFDEECTHAGCGLSDGDLDGNVIQCPCHGAEFDIRTGEVVSPPAVEPLQIYQVRIEGDDILIGYEA
jgi:3-phenylpropionate/trans-cinnamate dioxygenase ferredoxin subunit